MKYKEPINKVTARNIRIRLPKKNAKGEHIVRCYVTLQNAILGTIRWLLTDGKVMDRVELYHEITGFQFGVIRINAKGELISNFNYKDYL